MEATAGTRSIPTLIDGGVIVSGANEIISYVDTRFTEPPDAHLHAETFKQREWPHWLELHGSPSPQTERNRDEVRESR